MHPEGMARRHLYVCAAVLTAAPTLRLGHLTWSSRIGRPDRYCPAKAED